MEAQEKTPTFQVCLRETSSYLGGQEVQGVPAQIHLMKKEYGVLKSIYSANCTAQKCAV